jgi:hypothetical protein
MALVMPDQPAGDGRGSRLWELARDIARRPPIVSDDPAAVMVQFEDRWQELIA